ncbi:MAG: DNA-binding protein WhiA [Mogibacterium sp.]|nr:DNA-binding protein WhiA [Mogibacterium sp.]
MSFSSDVKGELARLEPDKKCCMLAEIAGFLRVSGSVRITGGSFAIVATTESAAAARHFKVLIEKYFRNKIDIGIGASHRPGSQGRKGRNTYYLSISPEEKSMQILRETGMILIREGDDYFSDGIYPQVIRSKCCKRAYLRGMFLSCGTMSDPRKSYHMEFVLDKEQSASDLKKLIGSFVDLSANMTMRGGNHIVYIKKASYISDMLGIIGAGSALLEFENIRVNKAMHGDIKRMINCDNANVDRTLSAAEEQKEWLISIASAEMERDPEPGELSDPGSVFWVKGLRLLPPNLKEVAFLRLYRPEASLTEIGELLSPQVGKAAVSKRFAKLRALAEAD